MIPFFSQEQVFNPAYQGIFLSFLKKMGFSLSRLGQPDISEDCHKLPNA
jgi:hypothetical protein